VSNHSCMCKLRYGLVNVKLLRRGESLIRYMLGDLN
jgi:hypothetical protein